jgi:Na+-transporting NADH:ubiquinone oxidoreductase subunit NqrB
MDFATLHKQRKFVMIAALVGVISMFLPWVSFMGFSTNGLHGSGFLILLSFIGAGVLAFLGDQKAPMAKMNWLGALGCGALAILLWVITFFDVSSALSVVGIGFWICIAAAAGVLACAYMFRDPKFDLKQSLGEMKKNVENKLDNDPNT